ncbi:phosphomevalonate kinase [Nocardia sp. NPDC101769]|uniref:phosphomevalonate kinase n=1 Tax=Nocardia sp. NPDC101769 TaxID=3364333 RepID=UPI00380A38D1
MITVAVPGKLYIVGEYAVLEPGSAAVLVGIDRQVRLRLTRTTSAGPAVRTITTSHAPGRVIEFIHRGTGFVPVSATTADAAGLSHVLAALEVVDRYAAESEHEPTGFALDIDSQLDDPGTGRKYGLGSSGAVTVAVVRAAARAYGLSLNPDMELKLALLSVFSVDPHCSGGDVAASARGGWVYYRTPDRAALTAALARDDRSFATLIRQPWKHLAVRSLPPPRGLSLEVGWVGRPAKSGELVSAMKQAVRHRRSAYREFVTASDHCVDRFAAACRDGDDRAVEAALSTAGRLLRGLATLSGLAIESPDLARLRCLAEELGAVAKSSGAGGGDCGIALIDPARAPILWRRWRAAGIEPLNLRVHQRKGSIG